MRLAGDATGLIAGTAREARAWVGRWLHPASAIIVPTLGAEPVLMEWAGRKLRFGGAPLHVTVMYPFLPIRRLDAAVHEGIADLAASVESFSYSLAQIGEFPGVFYLSPEPKAPFVELTAATQARWPECLPYGGAYDQVRPHVTIGLGDRPPADPAQLAPLLPIRLEATELWLIEQGAPGWRTRARFPLGAGSPPS